MIKNIKDNLSNDVFEYKAIKQKKHIANRPAISADLTVLFV